MVSLKTWGLDFRERKVFFIQLGGSTGTSRQGVLLRRSPGYCYLAALKTNPLAPHRAASLVRRASAFNKLLVRLGAMFK